MSERDEVRRLEARRAYWIAELQDLQAQQAREAAQIAGRRLPPAEFARHHERRARRVARIAEAVKVAAQLKLAIADAKAKRPDPEPDARPVACGSDVGSPVRMVRRLRKMVGHLLGAYGHRPPGDDQAFLDAVSLYLSENGGERAKADELRLATARGEEAAAKEELAAARRSLATMEAQRGQLQDQNRALRRELEAREKEIATLRRFEAAVLNADPSAAEAAHH